MALEEDGRELFRAGGVGFLGQEAPGLGEIINAVVVKVAGDFELAFMRDGAFADVAEEALAGEQACGAIDIQPWAHAVDKGVGVGKIRAALGIDAGERAQEDFLIQRSGHHAAGLIHGEQQGGGGEGNGQAGGLLGGDLIEAIEVAPAAVEVFVAICKSDLLLAEAGSLGFFQRVIFELKASRHCAQLVGVAPDMVGGGGIGSAKLGQFCGGPERGLGDGGFHHWAGICGIDEAAKRKAGSIRPQGLMDTGQWGVDIEIFRQCRPAPRAVWVLVGEQKKSTPCVMESASGPTRNPCAIMPKQSHCKVFIFGISTERRSPVPHRARKGFPSHLSKRARA